MVDIPLFNFGGKKTPEKPVISMLKKISSGQGVRLKIGVYRPGKITVVTAVFEEKIRIDKITSILSNVGFTNVGEAKFPDGRVVSLFERQGKKYFYRCVIFHDTVKTEHMSFEISLQPKKQTGKT